MSNSNPTTYGYNSSPTRTQHRKRSNGNFKCASYPLPTATYDQLLQSSDLFLEKLKSFHNSFGTKFKIPTVGGRPLDVHHLFVEVTSRGGLETVIRERRWKEVIAMFSFPITITSASFVLRKYYLSLLYHFEQVYLFHKQVPPASIPDSFNGKFINGFASTDEDADMNQLLLPGRAELQLGSSVTGTIDGKFDGGYLITVSLGSDQFKGVLYHIPSMTSISENCHAMNVHGPPRRRRRRSRLMLDDPSRVIYSHEASAGWALMEQPDQYQKKMADIISGEKYQG